MRELNLADLVLQEYTNACPAARRASRPETAPHACSGLMPSPPASTPTIFTELSSEERIEQADGIRAAADAGDQQIGQPLFFLQDLPPRFVADDALKIAHHDRIRMRAVSGAEDVMRGADVGDPIAHRFVDGFLQASSGRPSPARLPRRASSCERRSAPGVAIDRAHVDDAFEAEHRADRGGGDAVLARAGFGDDAGLAHASGEQDLADGSC